MKGRRFKSYLGSRVFNFLFSGIPLRAFIKRKGSSVSFVAGQPLGYYSSWPPFALSFIGVVVRRTGTSRLLIQQIRSAW